MKQFKADTRQMLYAAVVFLLATALWSLAAPN